MNWILIGVSVLVVIGIGYWLVFGGEE